MRKLPALKAGFIGACSLTILHEAARKTMPIAPHVDQIAMRALGKTLRSMGIIPSLKNLRSLALIGDLLFNGAYYSSIGILGRGDARTTWSYAWFCGLAAGAGAVFLPPRVGLGQQTSHYFPITASMTVAWYLIGALVTARVYRLYDREEINHKMESSTVTSRFIHELERCESDSNLTGLCDLFSEDAKLISMPTNKVHSGREGTQRFWQEYRHMFREIQSEFTRVLNFTEGDDHWSILEWTSSGSLPNGAPISYSGVSLLLSRSGRIQVFRTYYDPSPFIRSHSKVA